MPAITYFILTLLILKHFCFYNNNKKKVLFISSVFWIQKIPAAMLDKVNFQMFAKEVLLESVYTVNVDL